MEKKKKYLILGIIILLVLGGVTVAYLTWSSDKINIGLNSDCFTIDYTKGGDINNAKLKPINGDMTMSGPSTFVIREGMALTYANIGIKSSCNIEGYGSLYLDITSLSDAFTENGESYHSLYYAVLRNTSSVTDVTIDNLKDQEFEMITEVPQPITSTGKIKLLTEQLSNTEVNKYIIVVFVVNDLVGNDIIGASFSGKISAEANQKPLPLGVASTYINQLYSKASKEEVTNNSITYNKAPSVDLMNDRLGGTTSDLDGGNIRYYGVSPNNYIYFNCSDYSNQTSDTCEVWRIIGVFDGKVKLIRNTSIGNMYWNSSMKNDWSQATLQIYLNGDYYNDLINDTTRNLIAEATWNLGGWNSESVYPDFIYQKERGTEKCSSCTYDTTWIGKIALPYPSDYGYASEFGTEYCDADLSFYGIEPCNNYWLPFATGNLGNWLLTPNTKYESNSFAINNGSLKTGSQGYVVSYNQKGIFPTLYLNSDAEFKSGDGSSSNPYQLDA